MSKGAKTLVISAVEWTMLQVAVSRYRQRGEDRVADEEWPQHGLIETIRSLDRKISDFSTSEPHVIVVMQQERFKIAPIPEKQTKREP